METKVCSKCGEEKEVIEFYKGRAQCKKCRNEYAKKLYHTSEKVNENKKRYHEENKKKINARHRGYYKKNRDKIVLRHKEYRKKNKNKMADLDKKWRELNKESVMEYRKNRTEEAPLPYVKAILVAELKKKGVKNIESIPNELIQTRRLLIKLRRELKNN